MQFLTMKIKIDLQKSPSKRGQTLSCYENINCGFYVRYAYFPFSSRVLKYCTLCPEAAIHRCASKSMFLKISQYLQENIFCCLSPATVLKRDSNTAVFL